MARNYQDKSNAGGLPDSVTPTKLGGGEFTSLARETANAVIRSGQTPADASGTGEVFTQLAQAMFINGIKAGTFQDNGAANAYVLEPVSGGSGVVVATDYDQIDGGIIFFTPANAPTGASTVNLNSLGVVPLLNEDESAISSGAFGTSEIAIKYDASANSGNGAFLLLGFSVGASGGGGVVGLQVLTASSGNYTPGAGAASAIAVAVGGGGGGGGANVSTTGFDASGGGGGAGGTAVAFFTPSGSVAYTVGSGGGGGSSAGGDGGDGGTTTLTGIVIASGGSGGGGTGSSSGDNQTAIGGDGGTGTTGLLLLGGNDGSSGKVASDAASGGDGGSASFGGGGGRGASTELTGGTEFASSAGKNYGGGGGGAAVNASLSQAGSGGAPGVIYVFEFG